MRKKIEERLKNKQKKITNRDKLIQALKDNDLGFIGEALDCECCVYDADIFECVAISRCKEGMELWLDQEVSDE